MEHHGSDGHGLEPACEVRTWSETSQHIRPRRSLTETRPSGGVPSGR